MSPREQELHRGLLAHETFLRRLALHLVRDEARADDLVQNTWLTALESPPAHDGALRAWLATVARRLAGRAQRSSDRRRTREQRVARPEQVEGEVGAVDRRLDSQVLLVEELRKLPEPQRVALALRYSDDLAPRAIAERLGIPVDTVKARLRRGLATLRANLDARHGGNRESWALALLPELGLGAARAGTLIGKGLLMATVWKVATPAALVLALAGGWWVAQDAEPAGASVETLDGTAQPELDPAAPLAAPETTTARTQVPFEPSVASTPPRSTPPEPVPASSPWQLRLTLEGTFKQDAVALIRPHSGGVAWPAEVAVSETFEEPGTRTIDVGALFERAGTSGRPTPRDLLVTVSSAECAPAQTHVALERSGGDAPTPPAAPLQATVRLDPGAIFAGRLVTQDGNALETSAVLAFRREANGVRETVLASTIPDPHGEFRLVLAEAGPHVLAALSPDWRPTTVLVDAQLGTHTDLGDVLLEAGEEISGTLLTAAGEVSADSGVDLNWKPQVRVFFALEPRWLLESMLTFDAGRIEWGWRKSVTDASGRFRFRGLAPRDYGLSCRDTPGARIALGGNPVEQTVHATARGVELTVGWCTVDVQIDLPTTRSGMASLTVHRARWAPFSVTCGGEGETFSAPPETDLAITVEVDGFAPERVEFRTPAAGGHLVVPVTPRAGVDPATLVMKLEGPLPPQGTRFFVHDLNRKTMRVHWSGRPPLQTDASARRVELKNGELEIEKLAPGDHHFLVYAANSTDRRTTMLLDFELTCSLSAGEKRAERVQLVTGGALRLDVRDSQGARAPAVCELLGPTGEVPLGFIASDEDGTDFTSHSLSERAVNEVSPNLAVGRYQLRLSLAGHSPLEREIEIRAGELTLVEEQLQPE